MTDEELLKLAAKAAGISEAAYGWRPLHDDGDALRLAVELEFWIFAPDMGDMKAHVRHRDSEVGFSEKVIDDPLAATRRAIVRAAAEIGRNMS